MKSAGQTAKVEQVQMLYAWKSKQATQVHNIHNCVLCYWDSELSSH